MKFVKLHVSGALVVDFVLSVKVVAVAIRCN